MSKLDNVHCDFCRWILEHEESIRDGEAILNDVPVTPETIAVSFKSVVSLVFSSTIFKTSHQLKAASPSAFWPTLSTLFLGWWAFPLGPFYALSAIFHNLAGGTSKSVNELLEEAHKSKWNLQVDNATIVDVSDEANQRSVCKLSVAAREEVEERRIANGFDQDIGILLLPDEEFQQTCTIQFDYPIGDGRQYVFRDKDRVVLIGHGDEQYFQGRVVHFDGARFVIKEEFELNL